MKQKTYRIQYVEAKGSTIKEAHNLCEEKVAAELEHFSRNPVLVRGIGCVSALMVFPSADLGWSYTILWELDLVRRDCSCCARGSFESVYESAIRHVADSCGDINISGQGGIADWAICAFAGVMSDSRAQEARDRIIKHVEKNRAARAAIIEDSKKNRAPF